MRACAILGYGRRIALVVNVLYVLYGISVIVVGVYLFLLYVDCECHVLEFY